MKVQTLYGPPGTGKTSSLVDIAATHIDRGHKVTYLSFSKAAATEATSRLGKSGGLSVSTLHSMAYRVLNLSSSQVVQKRDLRALGDKIGIPFSGAEANTDDEQQEGDEYMGVISYGRNIMASSMEQAYQMSGQPGTADRFMMFAHAYEQWKEVFGFVDFNDMLALAATRTLPKLQVLIIDEAQDCSALQWQLLGLLAANSSYVYIAGDDDQAIFEWSGADPHGMNSFTEEHAGKARVLEQSYRVPRTVWTLADGITAQIETRVEKNFRPRDADGTVERWSEMTEYLDQMKTDKPTMILARDRFALDEIKKHLNQKLTPYRVHGGKGLWDNKYATAIRAFNAFQRGEDINEKDVVGIAHRKPGEWHGKKWQQVLSVPFHLHEFYEQADLDQPASISVSTIHQAKGMESERVVVDLTCSGKTLAGLYNNTLRDSELRVWYVAVTRAKEELHICGDNPLL